MFLHMVEFVQKPITQWDILPGHVKDRHIPTGEIHGSKIIAYSIPSDRIPTGAIKTWHVEDGAITTPKLADYSVTDVKIPTGEITFRRLAREVLHVGPIPDVDTEYAHNLGVTPEFVCIQETTEGVLDRVYLVTKSTTSITVKAKTSGVYAYIYLIA